MTKRSTRKMGGSAAEHYDAAAAAVDAPIGVLVQPVRVGVLAARAVVAQLLHVHARGRGVAVPTDRELDALKVLWERGQATVREICDAINARGEELAYTTVLTVLQTMEQKGLVGHKRAGKAYVYFAQVERERRWPTLRENLHEPVALALLDMRERAIPWPSLPMGGRDGMSLHDPD